jgi:hypothetical protein
VACHLFRLPQPLVHGDGYSSFGGHTGLGCTDRFDVRRRAAREGSVKRFSETEGMVCLTREWRESDRLCDPNKRATPVVAQAQAGLNKGPELRGYLQVRPMKGSYVARGSANETPVSSRVVAGYDSTASQRAVCSVRWQCPEGRVLQHPSFLPG